MNDLDKLIAWARAQVGTRENGENNVVYNTHYYGHEVYGPDYPWCMTFIWDGFRACGLSSLFLGGAKSAYCPYVASWALAHNQWVVAPYKAGDVLLYDWDGDRIADHTGLCIGMTNGRVDAIEGNVNDAVCITHRLPQTIMGAYRPAYNGTTAAPEQPQETAPATLPMVRRGDVSGAVLSVQVLLIHKWSVSCGIDGADADFGPATESAVKAFQRYKGLDQDGVVGPRTWAALVN